MKSFHNSFQVIFWVLIFTASIGCKAGREVRKTLPDAGDADLDNSLLPSLPFYATDTSIDGKRFTAIYLSNPDYDSLAFNIVTAYEPFAESVLTMIRQQRIRGVLIDFRQNNLQIASQTVFEISQLVNQDLIREKNSPVTIRFAWDEASFARATAFINLLKSSSQLITTEINPGHSFSDKNKDCFSATQPAFKD